MIIDGTAVRKIQEQVKDLNAEVRRFGKLGNNNRAREYFWRFVAAVGARSVGTANAIWHEGSRMAVVFESISAIGEFRQYKDAYDGIIFVTSRGDLHIYRNNSLYREISVNRKSPMTAVDNYTVKIKETRLGRPNRKLLQLS